MSNLTVRILFALAGIPIVFFLVWFNEFSRFGMMVGLIAVGSWEWARMVSNKISGPRMTFLSPVISALTVLAWIFSAKFPPALGLAACLALGVFLTVGFRRVHIENLFPWLALHLAAPLYLAFWGGMTLQLMGEGRGFASSAPFILVMVSMWTCDTFAYFSGRLFGKHKLAPQISPKKTWEGAIGGTLFTIGLVVWLGPWAFHTGLVTNVILGIVLSVAGQAGDLFESALKRWAGAKDSSQFFPGHGGVLDRLDSLFLAGPLAVVILRVAQS